MDTRQCARCKKHKKLSLYSWKNRNKGWKNSLCKPCHADYRREHYQDHKQKYIQKAKKWNKQQTKILQKLILEYLQSHSCVDCGVTDIRVLDFDHRKEKFMGVSQMVRNCYSIEAVKQEIEKCDVRCANCHRIKTFSQGNFWKHKMGP